MVAKRKSFGEVAEKNLRRPASMSDFLSNGDEKQGQGRETDEQKPSKSEVSESPPVKEGSVRASETKVADTVADKEESLSLSEQTTFYLDINVCETLDTLWIRLRQLAPKGRKKRISKSLIVNRMVEFCNASLEKEGLKDSKLVEMILED